MYGYPKSYLACFEYIEDGFRQLCMNKKDFYVLEDFNVDILSKGDKMCCIVKNNKLSQLTD